MKTYRHGNEVIPADLNEIQDDYDADGIAPWVPIGYGICDTSGLSSGTKRGKLDYGGGTFTDNNLGIMNNFYEFALDPADTPVSYNGSLRTLQYRLRAHVFTGDVVPASSITSVLLRRITHSAGSLVFTTAATLSPSAMSGVQTLYAHETTFNGSAITAGPFTVDVVFTSIPVNCYALMIIDLSYRGI